MPCRKGLGELTETKSPSPLTRLTVVRDVEKADGSDNHGKEFILITGFSTPTLDCTHLKMLNRRCTYTTFQLAFFFQALQVREKRGHLERYLLSRPQRRRW